MLNCIFKMDSGTYKKISKVIKYSHYDLSNPFNRRNTFSMIHPPFMSLMFMSRRDRTHICCPCRVSINIFINVVYNIVQDSYS